MALFAVILLIILLISIEPELMGVIFKLVVMSACMLFVLSILIFIFMLALGI